MSDDNSSTKSSLYLNGLGKEDSNSTVDVQNNDRETSSETPKTNSDESRVLIAEDEKAISSVLGIKLENSGFKVDIANNGQEAIELLDKNIYDVVLLDLIMPLKNGFDVLEHLKNTVKKVLVLVSSNLSQDIDIEKAKNLGAVDYYVKSDMTLSEIVDAVNKYKN